MIKKAVVTGANGFVGAAVCRELARQGVSVLAVVRNDSSNTDMLRGIEKIKLVSCDMSSYDHLYQLIPDRDIDVFYHFAWEGSAGKLRGELAVQLNNVKNTCAAVHACADVKCPRFVFAGSIMEYEIAAAMETDAAPNPNTLYSSAKLSADYMARTVACNAGVEYIRGIISNIYGPGETSPRLVNTTLRKLLRGEHCVFTPGDQMYDFIYLSDAARSFAAIGDKGKANRTYYIGSRCPKPLREFLLEMRDCVDPEIEIGLGEIPFSGVSLTYKEFDVDAVRKDTGFIPCVEFNEGINKTIVWLRGE